MHGPTGPRRRSRTSTPLRRLCRRRYPSSTASNDTHEPSEAFARHAACPGLYALQHVDNYAKATKPRVADLPALPFCGPKPNAAQFEGGV
jgi:hypothetical protein